MAISPDDPFAPPTTAVPMGKPAVGFVLLVVLTAAAVAAFLTYDAPWPTMEALFSAVALVGLEAVLNSSARFRKQGEHHSYASLDAPVVFAMLLLLDWKLFVVAVCAGECAIAASDILRKRNPTKWYVRVFNAAMLVLAGAAATTAFHLIPGAGPVSATHWTAAGPFLGTIAALVAYNVVDDSLVRALLNIANGVPIWQIRLRIRQWTGESAVVAFGVPLALCWSYNVWIAAFALLAMATGEVLLGIPELEYRLRTDGRTGLANASAFDDEFALAVSSARRDGGRLALLVIDIDNFKHVNDTHGHAAGDVIIAQFSHVLAAEVRAGDTLARVGGEEFTIVLRDADRGGALAFAERLRATIEAAKFSLSAAGTSASITASIGVASLPQDGNDERSLFHAADGALYAAKRGGRNAVCVAGGETFEPSALVPLAALAASFE